ncbi:methionyl-tRNA formyltransferase [Polynucleobacter paneuropaeus]|nr:methionyl-tRNA formyltransferase [Polynucleobacter paneuropaeus]
MSSLDPQKITIFLMTEKGFNFISTLAKKYKSIIGVVVVGSDKNIQKDFEDEIIEYCRNENIPFILRNNFKKINTEFAIAISWRWLISHPYEKLIIFHDSLLSKYRGFSPLVSALINGEKEVGVSAVLGADEYDAGPLIGQAKTRIEYPVKIASVISLINKNYTELGDKILQCILRGKKLEREPQIESLATYSVWRDDSDYRINWNNSSLYIKRSIDSLGYPYKGVSTKVDGKVIRIFEAKIVPDVFVENRDVGKILFLKNGHPIVICGEGLLEIEEAYWETNKGLISLIPINKFRMKFES